MKRREPVFTVRKLALIGLLAAMVFVFTFLHIDIPTVVGKTMIHFGNILCLLSGLLFGPLVGGLSAGFGSMLYDLMDPAYVAECWVTFLLKFAMGFLAGLIARGRSRQKNFDWHDAAGALSGAALYCCLYLLKNFIRGRYVQLLEVETVLIDLAPKALTTCVNAFIAVTASLLLASALRPRLRRAGLFSLL
ncbi:MAG: ECF transporter S component [Oscillospiraceae bacterium]|nr:ECF transporter S component [Oscillospiraceae bacterium]